MNDLNHQRVLVTGAVQGLGRAIAERFLEQGATVLLTDSVEDDVINTVTDNLESRFPGLAASKRTRRHRRTAGHRSYFQFMR